MSEVFIWGERKDASEDRLEGVQIHTHPAGNSHPTNLTTLLKNYQRLSGTSQMDRAKLRVTGPPLALSQIPLLLPRTLCPSCPKPHSVFLKTSLLPSFTYSFMTLHRALLYARLETGLSYELSEGKNGIVFHPSLQPGGYTVPPTNYKLQKILSNTSCSLNKYLLST